LQPPFLSLLLFLAHFPISHKCQGRSPPPTPSTQCDVKAQHMFPEATPAHALKCESTYYIQNI
jgi:hypothetical protein